MSNGSFSLSLYSLFIIEINLNCTNVKAIITNLEKQTTPNILTDNKLLIHGKKDIQKKNEAVTYSSSPGFHKQQNTESGMIVYRV